MVHIKKCKVDTSYLILLICIYGELNQEVIYLIIAKKSPLVLLPTYLQSFAVNLSILS